MGLSGRSLLRVDIHSDGNADGRTARNRYGLTPSDCGKRAQRPWLWTNCGQTPRYRSARTYLVTIGFGGWGVWVARLPVPHGRQRVCVTTDRRHRSSSGHRGPSWLRGIRSRDRGGLHVRCATTAALQVGCRYFDDCRPCASKTGKATGEGSTAAELRRSPICAYLPRKRSLWIAAHPTAIDPACSGRVRTQFPETQIDE